MLMDSFEVENFRSLKHLKLEKLARVNLLVGKNNSGKTSALEGIFLFTGANIATWVDRIDDERHLLPDDQGLAYLFYQFDASQVITFKAHIQPSHQSTVSVPPYDFVVTIEADESPKNQKQLALPGLWSSESIKDREQIGESPDRLLFTAKSTEIAKAPASKLTYTMRERRLGRNRRREASRALLTQSTYGHWLSTTVSFTELHSRIEYLKVRKQDERLVNVMRQIDGRIMDISLGSNDTIYFDLGPRFPKLLPLNLMGEGVQRLLAIVSAVAHTPGAIVQIDEIDNGLHYSALRILWKGVLQAAREYNVQIVATTHSAEALRHLTWVLDDEEYRDYRADVAAYTLIRANDDTVRSYRYDYEQLDFAMEHDIEVRN